MRLQSSRSSPHVKQGGKKVIAKAGILQSMYSCIFEPQVARNLCRWLALQLLVYKSALPNVPFCTPLLHNTESKTCTFLRMSREDHLKMTSSTKHACECFTDLVYPLHVNDVNTTRQKEVKTRRTCCVFTRSKIGRISWLLFAVKRLNFCVLCFCVLNYALMYLGDLRWTSMCIQSYCYRLPSLARCPHSCIIESLCAASW